MKDKNLKKKYSLCQKKVLFWRQFIAVLKIQQKNRFADVDVYRYQREKRRNEENKGRNGKGIGKKGKEYKKVIS